jgi:hypothetical protein
VANGLSHWSVAADTIRPWLDALGPTRFHSLRADRAWVAPDGTPPVDPVRPDELTGENVPFPRGSHP